MSLLTSYSSRNLVIDSALVMAKSVRRIRGYWAQSSSMGFDPVSYTFMFEATRNARMSFRYVGMTQSAAEECKTDMMTRYVRQTWTDVWDSFNGVWVTESGGDVLMSEIAMSHNEDGSYDVVVNVNETDVRIAMGPEMALVKVGICDSREYEGESEGEGEGGEHIATPGDFIGGGG